MAHFILMACVLGVLWWIFHDDDNNDPGAYA